MSIPAILFGIYVVLGFIAAVVMIILEHSKKKAGIATLVGDLSGFLPIIFIVFVALWPFCLALTLLSEDGTASDDKNTKDSKNRIPASNEKKPN